MTTLHALCNAIGYDRFLVLACTLSFAAGVVTACMALWFTVKNGCVPPWESLDR